MTKKIISIIIVWMMIFVGLSTMILNLQVEGLGINSNFEEHEIYALMEKEGLNAHQLRLVSELDIPYEYDSWYLVRINSNELSSLRDLEFKVRELSTRTTLYINGFEIDYTDKELPFADNLLADPVPHGSSGSYIIHTLGPIANEWIEMLKSEGVKIINYIPNYAYHVIMTPELKDQVEHMYFIDWIGDFHPAYKIAPDLNSEEISISLMNYPNFVKTIDEIAKSTEVISYFSSGSEFRVVAKNPGSDQIENIAKMSDVRYIGSHDKPQLNDEVGMQITGGYFDPALPSTPYRDSGTFGSYVNHLGYSGNGITLAIADSGIGNGTIGNAGHLDFTNRVIGGMSYEGTDWSDHNGHGTHVAGLVGGNGFAGTGVTYAGHGPYYVGMGLAYEANLFAQQIFNGQGDWVGPSDIYEIARGGYSNGAVIHQNSWGEGWGDGKYEEYDEAYDRAVRDANETEPGNQELTIIVSAGNDGPDSNTINSPSTGKNVISVGSVQNYMPDSEDFGDSYGGGMDPDVVSNFSARGWTDDGRIKPDIVAPGQAALSACSPVGGDLHGLYSEDIRYSWASGTSMSAPTASGAAAVLYEWYQYLHGTTPSPAMIKAILINSAVDIGAPDIPNQDEGWGRVYLPAVIDPDAHWDVHDQGEELTTGEVNEFYVRFDNPAEPFKITLTYTDKYALDGDTVPLKNQVNLEVIAPNNDVYHGNAFESGWTPANTNPNETFDTDSDGYDDRNNVECVYIPPGELQGGFYTVRIIGTNIVADCDNDTEIDQDYALVMYNAKRSVDWPSNWNTIGTDSAGDAPIADTTLNIQEVKAAINQEHLFIRLLLEGTTPTLTENTWWIYLDETADGENDWLICERTKASGGILSYKWNATTGNWSSFGGYTLNATVSDNDNDSAVRSGAIGSTGYIDFALRLTDYPTLDLNNFNVVGASDQIEDLNLSDDTNRNPTDLSDPSRTDVPEFDDSVGPLSYVNAPPTITTIDIESAMEDEKYFNRYEAIDPQNDPLVWTLSTNSTFLTIGENTGLLRGFPTNANIGDYWVNVTVSDLGGLYDFHNFTLTVLNRNPVILTEDVLIAASNDNYYVKYLSDENGIGDIQWHLSTNASWLSINVTTGVLKGIPSDLDVGIYWVNVSVSDGNGGSFFHNFTLRVLLSRGPIRIDSDLDFASQSSLNGWPGSGALGDPYIIQGYDINVSSGGPAIYIGNTTVHFEVRINRLRNASLLDTPYFLGVGIQLYKASNGTFKENILTKNIHSGIYLEDSFYNTISENELMNNNISGCYLENSHDTLIFNNSIESNHDGVYIRNSGNNNISNNDIISNKLHGVGLWSSFNSTLTYNRFSNNDRGIYAQTSSKNFTVAYNEIFGGEDGIYLQASEHSTVNNNNLSNIDYAISFSSSSSNNTFSNNFITKSRNGFYATSSSNHNILTNNSISRCDYGLKMSTSSNNNTIANNNVSDNDKGIYLSIKSSYNLVKNNEVLNNNYGIYMYSSTFNNITYNNVSENENGIYLSINAMNNTISRNRVWNNEKGVFLFSDACENMILNNNIWNNTYGIALLSGPSNNTIMKNDVFSNVQNGIWLTSNSKNNIIMHNNVSMNENGMDLMSFADNNTIAFNNVYSNEKNGFDITSSYNVVTNNNISNNSNGILLSSAHYNYVAYNDVSINERGFYLANADANILTNNNVTENGYGFQLLSGSDNNIHNNLISHNTQYGIYISIASNNTIYHNYIIENTDQAFNVKYQILWDNGYPIGGNFWSDYQGVDEKKGPFQDIPGSDGIGDTPYTNISGFEDPIDRYPLMVPEPREVNNYTILRQGWNLISIPFIQPDHSYDKVLEMISGYYDAIQFYDNTGIDDPWKDTLVGKPFGNELFELNHTMGFWIHINHSGETIFQYNGTEPTENQTISLHQGWNMVGYPSLSSHNRTEGLNNLEFGLDIDVIQWYDTANNSWHFMGTDDFFIPGRGYWVHSLVETSWEVPM